MVELTQLADIMLSQIAVLESECTDSSEVVIAGGSKEQSGQEWQHMVKVVMGSVVGGT